MTNRALQLHRRVAVWFAVSSWIGFLIIVGTGLLSWAIGNDAQTAIVLGYPLILGLLLTLFGFIVCISYVFADDREIRSTAKYGLIANALTVGLLAYLSKV